jgi:hypothetical protein
MGYLDSVKGYRLFYPSTDRLIINQNVRFVETPLHAPSETHTDTFVAPPTLDINYDELTHLDHGSYMSFESYLEYYEHAYVGAPQIPKWA